MASRATNLFATSVGVGSLIVIGSVVWFGTGSEAVPTPGASGHPVVEVVDTSTIAVHVSGAVVHPGVVVAPPSSRVADIVVLAGGATGVADLGSMNLAAPVRDGDHVVVPTIGQGTSQSGSDAPFDLNTASASDFEALPGVGPVLAERIISYREANGPFGFIEDLLDVPGIGEAKLAAIKAAIEAR